MKVRRFTIEKHPPTLTPTTKQGYSQLLMDTFHRKKKLAHFPSIFFGMKKSDQIAK